MASFVKSIFLPKSGKDGILQTAYPVENNSGIINIICGPNNSGKTYLLRKLRTAFANYQNIGNDTSSDIHIEMTEPVDGPLEILYFGKSWQDKERAGIIPVEMTALKLPGDRPPYRHASLSFLLRQLLYHFPDKKISQDDWFNKKKIRISSLELLDLEYTLYKCSPKDNVVKRIESVLGGNLFFRRASKNLVELTMVTLQNLSVPYPEWSDGQKAVFYLLLMLDYSRPSIFLLDEIENHLHPFYMTSIMHFIKESASQSFIATHHPHVIFTELADRVFYLEVLQSSSKIVCEPVEKTIKYKKVDRQSAPRRKVTTLNDGFQKISATYKLFDLQDHQLLKQCSNISKLVEVEFYKAFLDLFKTEAAPALKKSFPDRQTQLLAQIIKKSLEGHAKEKIVKILDLGAGIGRISKELAKLSIWQLNSSIHWICWEPNQEFRNNLVNALRDGKIRADIPCCYNELPLSSCQIALIANVLHEVTPEDFASLIYSAFRAIQNINNGKIVILEIYPLLRAEKYAVAYPYSYLVRLLNNCGFLCTSDTFSINDAQGYCVIAKPSGVQIDKENIKENLLEIWEELEREICSSYACQEEIKSHIEYRGMIQELTTLASITAWKKGIWQPEILR